MLAGRDLVAAIDRMARSTRRVSCLTITIAGAVASSAKAPVCRDAAGRGLRIRFTISDQASAGNIAVRPGEVRVTISDQGAAGGLISY